MQSTLLLVKPLLDPPPDQSLIHLQGFKKIVEKLPEGILALDMAYHSLKNFKRFGRMWIKLCSMQYLGNTN
jgi:hypothetical protein